MTKDYIYKGYTYYYCRHYKKWILETDADILYLDTKKQCIEHINCLLKKVNA